MATPAIILVRESIMRDVLLKADVDWRKVCLDILLIFSLGVFGFIHWQNNHDPSFVYLLVGLVGATWLFVRAGVPLFARRRILSRSFRELPGETIGLQVLATLFLRGERHANRRARRLA